VSYDAESRSFAHTSDIEVQRKGVVPTEAE